MKGDLIYKNLKVSDLIDLLKERKINFSGKTKKADLIKLLEKYDKKYGLLDNDKDEILSSKSSVKDMEEVEAASHTDEEENIPDRYNETRIVILPKDPFWIFAYWDISDSDIEKLKNINEYRWVLRVYAENQESFDIIITDGVLNWYINVPKAGESYYVDLGVIDKEGNFILIATSNKITTPPGKISDIVDEEWMLVEEEFEELYKVIADGNVGGSSEVVIKKFLNKLERELSSTNSGSFNLKR